MAAIPKPAFDMGDAFLGNGLRLVVSDQSDLHTRKGAVMDLVDLFIEQADAPVRGLPPDLARVLAIFLMLIPVTVLEYATCAFFRPSSAGRSIRMWPTIS